jgi:sugar lactone lactonase YvrE
MTPRLRTLTRGAALTAAALSLVLTPAVPAAAHGDASLRNNAFPTTIALPDGFRPEGIAIGPGPFAYFGSLANGSIYRASLITGAGKIVSTGPGTSSVGVKTDDRGRIFVAGGGTGSGRVVDLRSGRILVSYQFTPPSPAPPAPPTTFVNDVVLTPDAAYFTDSRQAAIYKVPLGRRGSLPPATGFVRIPLTGDIVVNPAVNNANGIARTPDGKSLIIIQSNTGLLFKVNPRTGATTQITVPGDPLVNGDGLLLIGRTLYVVQNRLNTIAVVELNRSGTAGEVVKLITDPRFDVPTTVAAFGKRLYLPNARFGIANPDTATYSANAVRR